MIKESIEYIANKIQAMGLFEKVYSLVEIVTNPEGRAFPAVYSGNGKYSIIHYSFNNGTAYLRKNGSITFSDSDVESYNGCSNYQRAFIPLVLVAFKQKSKLPIDCSYSEELLAETIMAYLANNVKDAKQSINVKQFKLSFIDVNTNSAEVWNNETANIEQVDINYDIACVSFLLQLEMIVDVKCLNNFCEPLGA